MKPHIFIALTFAFVRLALARDLTLDEALDRALEKNPRIQQAKAVSNKPRASASFFARSRYRLRYSTFRRERKAAIAPGRDQSSRSPSLKAPSANRFF